MFKSIFKVVSKVTLCTLILSFNFLFSFKLNREIRAEDLHIFNILNNAKLVLMEDLAIADHSGANNSVEDLIQDQNKKDDAPDTFEQTACEQQYSEQTSLEQTSLEQKSLDLVEKEIELLKEIVQGFNKGLLFFVEYRFISVCNFFSNFDSIEPRDVRAFKRKVTKFDNFIQNYSLKKKETLDKDEVELCEKILIFDQILLTCFLRHDFYNIDLTDEVVDACFFRPVEFMGEHPLLTTTAAAIILSILFYYYVYPNLDRFYNSEKEDNSPLKTVDENVVLDEKNPTLKNESDAIDVAQVKVFKQEGRMCGANAAFRLIAFHESKGDVVQAYRLANDAKRFNECCRHWAEIIKVRSLNDLHSGHLDIIIKDYNEMHVDNPIPEEDLTMADDSTGLRDRSKGNFADFYGIDDTVVGDSVLPGKRSKLKEGHTQYVIINTAENDIPGFGKHKDSDKAGSGKDKKDEQKKDEAKPKESVKSSQSEKSWFGRLLESIFGKNETDKDADGKGNGSGNCGSSAKKSKKWKEAAYGHWLSFMFVNDPRARDGVRVIMADSIGNPNRTRDPILNGLHQMLVHGS